MKNIEEINNASVKKILTKKKIPEFFAGDTIKVGVRIAEGKRERIQYFEGVCIAKKNRDINSSFTVRKISFGEGVERTFALYSSAVDTIKVIRSGKVRRAKLYYLRDRTGKSARISEKIKKTIGIDLETKVQEVNEENLAAPENENTKKEAPKAEVKKEETKPAAEAPKAAVKPVAASKSKDKVETDKKDKPKKVDLKNKEEKK